MHFFYINFNYFQTGVNRERWDSPRSNVSQSPPSTSSEQTLPQVSNIIIWTFSHLLLYSELELAIRIRNWINPITYGAESETEIRNLYCGFLIVLL